jgi:hypothetical protein
VVLKENAVLLEGFVRVERGRTGQEPVKGGGGAGGGEQEGHV